MEELAVRINICNRLYPMRVQVQDEKRVRTAGRLLNEQVAAYTNQFGIEDKQDLLAMVAFDCLVKTLRLEETMARETQVLGERVDALTRLVEQALT